MRVKGRRIYLFILFQVYLFGFVMIPSGIIKGIALLSLVFMACVSKNQIRTFNVPLSLMFFFCFLNMINCYLHRGQTPWQFLIGSEFTNILGILSLFAIQSFKSTSKEIEDCLIAVSFTAVVCYLIQHVFYPISIFAEIDTEFDAMGARLRMPGQCLFSLLAIYSFGRLTEKVRIKHILYLVLSLICLFLLGFRSQMAIMLFIFVVIIIFRFNLSIKRIVPLVALSCVLLAASQTTIIQQKISQMVERNERDNFDNDNYIRAKEYMFYTAERQDLAEKVLGIGLPNENCAPYGTYIRKLKSKYNLVWADWGFIGLSWMLGIPAVLCMFWYSIKGMMIKTEQRYLYLKFWLLFILLGTIMTREFYRSGCFAIQGIVLYLLSVNSLKKA